MGSKVTRRVEVTIWVGLSLQKEPNGYKAPRMATCIDLCQMKLQSQSPCANIRNKLYEPPSSITVLQMASIGCRN